MAINDDQARAAGYYLGRRHGLVHRHHEKVCVAPDQTARWQLTVDFELPGDPSAWSGRIGGECHFLFPLMFLRKAEGRPGLTVRDEEGTVLATPTRVRSNWISAVAASQAAARLCPPAHRASLNFASLQSLLAEVAERKPYEASVILNKLLGTVDGKIVAIWEEEGLIDDLKMLVEHSLLWIPLQGNPGQQRVIEVSHDLELVRRAIVRWRISNLKSSRFPRLRKMKPRKVRDPLSVLDTGDAIYGHSGYRVSFSALAERLVQPLAWMPIPLDFPTIYTGRCDSYHFELSCPAGLSPRELKVAADDGEEKKLPGRKTLGSRVAHLYLPGGRAAGDLLVRATVGVGGGAFPILWFLAGAITTIVLWALAATEPTLLEGTEANAGKNEIAAGLLLVVPALLGVLIYGEESSVTRLIGGARILLLVTGLCALAATSVLIGAGPFGLGPVAIWTACATVATAATVPLATSWLLSSPLVWHQLKKLDTPRRQYIALALQILVAVLLVAGLMLAGDSWIVRAVLALAILLMTVPLILLASNRAAVAINANRRFLSASASVAALTCFGLGCIEMRAAFDDGAELHELAEFLALALLLVVVPLARLTLRLATSPFGQKEEEVHVPPELGRAFLSRERIRELRELREMQGRDRCACTQDKEMPIVSLSQ